MLLNILKAAMMLMLLFMALVLIRNGKVIVSAKGRAFRWVNNRFLWGIFLSYNAAYTGLSDGAASTVNIASLILTLIFAVLLLLDYNSKYRLIIYNIKEKELIPKLKERFTSAGIAYELYEPLYIPDEYRSEVIIKGWRKANNLMPTVDSLKKGIAEMSFQKTKGIGIAYIVVGCVMMASVLAVIKF